ncbi:cupin domain-containing protein [Pedobacter sp. L105]|uniref:cupin domain-containing protein n=1 Tax=Pedobacter sp. L105 TaxID=1641871 RepID=UPI00131B97AF|nr:cupin domain-containing protein [Pedobacter sp. L105]
MKNIPSLTTVGPQEGQVLSVVGDSYRVIISGKQTNGAYAVIDMLVPPGAGPGPHSHAGIQESFYVLEGEIEVKTETKTYIAKKGAFVNIPMGGMVHCFKNKTDQVAQLLCTVVPSGLEEFFQEIGKPIPAGTFLPPPELTHEDIEQLKKIAEKYGQKLFPPDYLG